MEPRHDAVDRRTGLGLNGVMPDDAPVLLFLHGHYGVRDDLAWVAQRTPAPWRTVLLQAPLAIGERFSWFEAGADPRLPARSSDIAPAADRLLRWIDDNVGDAPVAAVGWSQGGATALQAMRRAPRRLSFVVALGAFMGIGGESGDAELARLRPPVFWGRGGRDDVIPPADLARMHEFLPGHTTLEERLYPEAGHDIPEAMAEDAMRFVAARSAEL
jgi:phospholipase/carboxylesterase